MKNYREMIAEIQNKESELNALKNKARSIPGFEFIQAVENKKRLFDDEANLLVFELNERDEPMTYYDIRDIFTASGYDFNEGHIEACHPDSEETVQKQIDYYRE